VNGQGEAARSLPPSAIRPPFWEVLTRNLTWRSRVAEAREREPIEQELQVAHQIQQALLPEATPKSTAGR
jgi:hypothetical protein